MNGDTLSKLAQDMRHVAEIPGVEGAAAALLKFVHAWTERAEALAAQQVPDSAYVQAIREWWPRDVVARIERRAAEIKEGK